MNTVTNPKVITAMKHIAAEHAGVLQAVDVVETAKNPKSPLHSHFNWDDTDAAHQYRLEQARQLIRAVVEYLPFEKGKEPQELRVFVSLTPDRKESNGGYRHLVTVLSDAQLRQQLLEDAYNEMIGFRKKYQMLSELADIFKEMSAVEKRRIKKYAA